MFLLGILYALLITASAEFCYKDVENACSPKLTSVLSGIIIFNFI
jgi:hypothetical protein